jgi:ABC-type Fe3+ transport system permease subunit
MAGATASASMVDVFINTISYSLGGALVNAGVTCIIAYLTARYAYFYSKIIYSKNINSILYDVN